MEHIGYSLIDKNNDEISNWKGGTPDVIHLPNGDNVHCPKVGDEYQEWRLVERWHQYGPASKIFDGEKIIHTEPEPVPATISDRQFFQLLAMTGVISTAEALAAVKTGTVPAALEALVNGLPSDQKFGAEMLLSGATVFERQHPMTIAMAEAYGWSSEQLDSFWITASRL